MSTKFKLRLETGRLMWQASIFYFHVLNVFWLYCVILFSLIMRGQTDIKHSQSKKKNICRYIQYLDVIKQCHVSVTWRKQVLWTKEFKAKKKNSKTSFCVWFHSFYSTSVLTTIFCLLSTFPRMESVLTLSSCRSGLQHSAQQEQNNLDSLQRSSGV